MVEVVTNYGMLEGEKLKTITDDSYYYSFKGVPYAAPPIGKLRFMEPQPLSPWQGVKKAIQHGPVCPQHDIFTGEKNLGSEDCLYLNVYTPDIEPTAPLPVMVFIHGGGLKSGSGNDDFFGPDFLVNHGVVLVTINYRLEVFGFLCLDTKEVPGNAGFKDQVAALKWVKQNISNFGGDHNNVTVFGESAGGLSTTLHVLSPLSKGLFQRAIVMSGSPFCDWAQSFEPRRRAFVLGKQLGLETDDPNELVEFLQSVPVEKLIDVNPCILSCEPGKTFIKMFHFTTVIEKNLGHAAFLPDEPENILKSGNINEVDVIIGYTSEELIIGLLDKDLPSKYRNSDEMLVPKRILYNATASKILQASDLIKKHYLKSKESTARTRELVRFWSQVVMIYPIQKLLTLLAETGKCKTFFYKFSCVTDRNVYGALGKEYGIQGASHLDDLLYIFQANCLNVPVNKESQSYKMITQFCSLFTNFAKYGHPTPSSWGSTTWPEYDTKSKAYLDIDEKLTVGNNLDEDVIRFWKRIYEFVGVPY
ncbi:unnamed protein product [Leptosia nina]|uniref:Carboxylic ester hydrolase n=1 Tax=Leptosia nina TaxID=320188 RepID=A0AAV1K1T6_9NEOP